MAAECEQTSARFGKVTFIAYPSSGPMPFGAAT